MPSKSASTKKRSKSASKSPSTKKRRTGSATRLTPKSPNGLNMTANMGPSVRAPAGPANAAAKSPNKPVVKHPGRALTERELMEARLKAINNRYNHYRRTGQYRPI